MGCGGLFWVIFLGWVGFALGYVGLTCVVWCCVVLWCVGFDLDCVVFCPVVVLLGWVGLGLVEL